jgi:SAM-dependent methyltransferase
LLNWAARYFPIIRLLKLSGVEGQSILEIGCGPCGLAYFYKMPIVGCDIRFSSPPLSPMRPAVASAVRLPFGSSSFDGVVASDMLEHVRPTEREAVVREALRVTRKVAVFGFPCGPRARALDEALFEDYSRMRREPPEWLLEHMQNPFPDEQLFEQLPRGWRVQKFGNEHLRFHYWMVRREMGIRWNRVFSFCLNRFPRPVEFVLQLADREPCYRQIFVVARV